MTTVLYVSTIQWGLVLGGSLGLHYAFGGFSVLPIPAGLFLGALLFFWLLDPTPLTRPRVRWASKSCGMLSIVVFTLLYWTLFALDPQSFSLEFTEVVWLGPVLGLGGGLLAMACTLIAGDTAATLRSETLS